MHGNQEPCAASLVFVTLSGRERLQHETETSVLAGMTAIASI